MGLKRKTVGTYQARATMKDNTTREKRGDAVVEGAVANVGPFMDLAERMDVPLETVLQSVPRAKLSIGTTICPEGPYHSVRIEVGMDVPVPSFESKALKQTYLDLYRKADHIAGDLLEKLRDEVGV